MALPITFGTTKSPKNGLAFISFRMSVLYLKMTIQNGLTSLLDYMAFNGTQHFPDKRLSAHSKNMVLHLAEILMLIPVMAKPFIIC